MPKAPTGAPENRKPKPTKKELELADRLAQAEGEPAAERLSAVRTLTCADESQVTFDRGFGSSCSQPLLALRS